MMIKMNRHPVVCLALFFAIARLHAGDLNLSAALEEALNNNPELLSARRLHKAEAAAFWEQLSPENPELEKQPY